MRARHGHGRGRANGTGDRVMHDSAGHIGAMGVRQVRRAERSTREVVRRVTGHGEGGVGVEGGGSAGVGAAHLCVEW